MDKNFINVFNSSGMDNYNTMAVDPLVLTEVYTLKEAFKRLL